MRKRMASEIPPRPAIHLGNTAVEQMEPSEKPMTKIYAGRYFVTDDGRVFTMAFTHGRYHRQKCRLNPNGYPRANIHGKDKYVHRLVAECFIPTPRNCREVNHIDGVKTNSRVSNLEWCTSTENHIHAIKTGLIPQELRLWIARRPHPKKLLFNDSQIKQIRKMLAEKIPSRVIAGEFKCSPSTIDNVRRKQILQGIAPSPAAFRRATKGARRCGTCSPPYSLSAKRDGGACRSVCGCGEKE